MYVLKGVNVEEIACVIDTIFVIACVIDYIYFIQVQQSSET